MSLKISDVTNCDDISDELNDDCLSKAWRQKMFKFEIIIVFPVMFIFFNFFWQMSWRHVSDEFCRPDGHRVRVMVVLAFGDAVDVGCVAVAFGRLQCFAGRQCHARVIVGIWKKWFFPIKKIYFREKVKWTNYNWLNWAQYENLAMGLNDEMGRGGGGGPKT